MRIFLYLGLVLALAGGHCRSSDHEDDQYSRQWAVYIEGGEDVAEEIARRHGFVNLGKVFFLIMIYLKRWLILPGIYRGARL